MTFTNKFNSSTKFNGKTTCCIQLKETPDFKDNSRNIVVGSIGNMISDFSEETIISFLLANNFKICKNSKAEKKIKYYLSNL
mgnify:CR=1 FL=1|tara:strand:+ start:7676 stop:7921 length:246 start_codon:yes stop_codon:yes gene_type:complete